MLALNCSAHKNDNNICETKIRTLLKFCNIRNNLLIISRNYIEQNNIQTDNEFSIDDNNFIIKSKKYQIKKNGNTSANDINIINKTSILQETLQCITPLKPTIILSANEVNSRYDDFASKLRDFNISVMVQGHELSQINKSVSNIDFIVNYEPHHDEHVLMMNNYETQQGNSSIIDSLLNSGNSFINYTYDASYVNNQKNTYTTNSYVTPQKNELSIDEESPDIYQDVSIESSNSEDTNNQVTEFNIIKEPTVINESIVESRTIEEVSEDTGSHMIENIIDEQPFSNKPTIELINEESQQIKTTDKSSITKSNKTFIKILIYIIIIICICWNMDIINNTNELLAYFEVNSEMTAITNEIPSNTIINDISSGMEIHIGSNAISDDQEIVVEDMNTSHIVTEFADNTSTDDLMEQAIEYIF